MFSSWALAGIAATWIVVGNAHTVITYPGWRGNNLQVTDEFPYGMQRSYPCGGLPLSTNRTNWPISGGAIAMQPGWFAGHRKSLIYINLGLGTDGPDGGPLFMNHTLNPPFQILGPSNNPYPGTLCLPQIPIPSGLTVNVGDHATIQIIETVTSGAALYNCVDITFALPEDIAEVDERNCFNSSTIGFSIPDAVDTTSSSLTSLPTETTTSSRRQLFSSCTPCPTFPTSVATATPSACPAANGNMGGKDAMGVGLPLGVLALGILGL